MSQTTFQELRIFGFGALGDYAVRFEPGLNLVTGANEAGKSTLLAFIRAVAYGFDRRSSAQRYEPRTGGAFGGELVVATDARVLIARRVASRRRLEGELSVRDDEGSAVTLSSLSAALGGVSRELFSQVFSVTLDELRQFEALTSESAVAEALFAAGAQGAARVPAVMAEFLAQGEAAWAPRAYKRPLNQAFAALEATRERAASAFERPETWAAIVEAKKRSEAKRTRLENELSLARSRHARIERLERVRPLVYELGALAPSASGTMVDPASLTRAEMLDQRVREVVEQCAAARARSAQLDRRQGELSESIAKRHDIEYATVALARWRSVSAVASTLAARQNQLAERRRSLDLRTKRLVGRPVGDDWLLQPSVGVANLAELQAIRHRTAELAVERSRANESHRLCKADLERVEFELVGNPTSAPSPTCDELDERAITVRRVLDAAAQRDAARERLQGLGERLTLVGAPSTRHGSFAWVFGALGAGTLVGAFAAGPLGAKAVIAGCGVALLVAAAVIRRVKKSRTDESPALATIVSSWRDEYAQLSEEHRAAADRFAALARRAEVESVEEANALLTQLDEWRRCAVEQLRRFHEVQRLTAQRERLVERLAQTSRELARVEAELDSLQTQLDARTTTLGFSPGLDAQQVIDLFAGLTHLRDEDTVLRHDAALCLVETNTVAETADEVIAAAALVGAASGGSPDVQAERLAAILAVDQQERTELAEVSIKFEMAAEQCSRLAIAEASAEEALAECLRESRTKDLAELRLQVQVAQRRAACDQRRRELESQLRLLCDETVEALAHECSALGGEALEEARAQVASLEAQIDEENRALGELEARQQHVEQAALASELRAVEATQCASIIRQATTCATARLAAAIVHRSRQRFEAMHQPAVVKRAGHLFAALTDRRYVALAVDASNRALSVLDRTGAVWPLGVLSRGTRELLLLAFRMAVIEDFGRSRVRLPVLLDDVLVNLDPSRARLLVESLAELSSRHQVIALTCHEHVRRLFAAAGANIIAVQQSTQLSLLAE